MNPPNLTFRHTFSNGLVVTLTMIRESGKKPRMVSDKRDFHEGIEAEYRAWCAEVVESAWPQLTLDEQTKLALSGAQRVKRN